MKEALVFLFCLGSTMNMAQEGKRHWIIPDHITAQFAGSMGLFAAGFGYASPNDKSYLDLMMGYVPERYSYNQLGVASIKFAQVFWRSDLLKQPWNLTPVVGGIYITYTFGKNFHWPEHYPKGYYWWSESVRPNIFIGGNISKKIKEGSRVMFYYEVGTNELKLTSYLLNRETLSLTDMLHAGLGIRYSF